VEGHRAEIFELAPDGHPLGPSVALDTPSGVDDGGMAFDRDVIQWAEGRWAVALAVPAGAGSAWAGRLYDEHFRPAADWQQLGTSDRRRFEVARLTRGDRWLAIALRGDTLGATAFSESRPAFAVEHLLAAGQTLDAVGMRSRVAVLVGGVTTRSDENLIAVVGGEPGLDVLGTVVLSSRGVERASLAAVRDVALAATLFEGEVVVQAIDPFAMTAVSPAESLGSVPRDTMPAGTTVDAIGSSKLGLAGVCYGGATGSMDAPAEAVIDFAVVGPDGARRGAPVRVTDDHFRAAVSCTVGTDDEGFLVAWWTGLRLWVRRIHVPH
jgi:hypothetical protein